MVSSILSANGDGAGPESVVKYKRKKGEREALKGAYFLVENIMTHES